MYSISEVAKITGITAYTLRYYEQIGVLPPQSRHDNGTRVYNDEDLRFIRFIHGLKQTGMKLEDIASFAEDGCLLSQMQQSKDDLDTTLHKRIAILDEHIHELEQQMKQLESVKAIANEKRELYFALLNDRASLPGR
jgi:DNA-binding transcriptional MerR regulator